VGWENPVGERWGERQGHEGQTLKTENVSGENSGAPKSTGVVRKSLENLGKRRSEQRTTKKRITAGRGGRVGAVSGTEKGIHRRKERTKKRNDEALGEGSRFANQSRVGAAPETGTEPKKTRRKIPE